MMTIHHAARARGHASVTVFLALLMTGCAASTGGKAGQQSAKPAQQAAQPPACQDDSEQIPLAVRIFFKPLPAAMPGSENDTPEMISLGRKLYFEKGISLNKTQSCADCHALDQSRAGADGMPTSRGANGDQGKRNAPTVLNAGFELAQFWDGRAADLVEQAKGPVLNPAEMAMHSPEDVVDRLTSIRGYDQAFKAAYPNQAEPLTFDNTARAIAAFERTLITPARFDRYLQGETNALTPQEKLGMHRFMETGCTECHSSVTVGGRLFEKVGVYHSFPSQEDPGRYSVTHQDADRMVFKVPTLRNITLTSPYFHDGHESKLPEAVKLMAWMQLDAQLSPADIDEIVLYLHALEAECPIDIEGP
jgi:cytochrome c peroxidase